MQYDKSVKNIEEYTGLDYHYILKCVREMPDVFTKDLVERGDNNSLSFSSTAQVIFDKIKQLKEGGQNLKSMRLYFQQTMSQNDKSTIKSPQNEEQNDLTKFFIDKIEEANKKAFEAFNETIKTKDSLILSLEKNILLITNGKTPEEAKAEYAEKQEKLQQLQYDLEAKEKEISEQKRREESALKSKEEEIQTVKILVEEKDQELVRTKTVLEKQQDLLKQLTEVEGKWFAGKKRKQILEELKKIEQPA